MSKNIQGYGLCLCGCGEQTRIPSQSCASKGWQKGVPLKFIKGHSMRLARETRSNKAVGNTTISTHGYVLVTLGEGDQQYEHVMVAEKVLGRPLRFISTGHPNNEVVHHINGVKTDNRRKNLLVCSHQYHIELHARLEASPNWPEFQPRVNHPNGQRRTGSAGFKGVRLARDGRWQAVITVEGRCRKLGRHNTPEDAARAYDAEALRLFGPTWVTNASMELL